MDLLYTNINSEVRKELESLGVKIEDASDYIHEERVAVYFSEEKKIKYNEILKKFGIIENSMNYLLN